MMMIVLASGWWWYRSSSFGCHAQSRWECAKLSKPRQSDALRVAKRDSSSIKCLDAKPVFSVLLCCMRDGSEFKVWCGVDLLREYIRMWRAYACQQVRNICVNLGESSSSQFPESLLDYSVFANKASRWAWASVGSIKMLTKKQYTSSSVVDADTASVRSIHHSLVVIGLEYQNPTALSPRINCCRQL